MRKTTSGFTIVELAVVIVIIAILVGIVALTYGNIRERSLNASRITEANNVVEALTLYRSQNGKFPAALDAADAEWCVGGNFPDIDNDGVGDCRDIGFTNPANIAHENASLNSDLKASGLKEPGDRRVVGDGYLGPSVKRWGGDNQVWVYTYLDANECPKPYAPVVWTNRPDGVIMCRVRIDK